MSDLIQGDRNDLRAHKEAAELEKIEGEIIELGRQMMVKRTRAIDILFGRIGTTKSGKKFRIVRADLYFGGGDVRLFFRGPVLKKDGTAHARAEESATLRTFEKIERAT